MSICCVGIVGCGPHGRALARLFSEAGLHVRMLPWGREVLASLRETDQIELCRDPADLHECDLVLESVTGDGETRLEAVRALEPHLSAGAILALGTADSALDAMLAGLARPTQAIGLRFEPKSDRVDIRTTDDTAPGVHQAIRQLCAQLGRVPAPAYADAAE